MYLMKYSSDNDNILGEKEQGIKHMQSDSDLGKIQLVRRLWGSHIKMLAMAVHSGSRL